MAFLPSQNPEVEEAREDGSPAPVVYAALKRESYYRTLEELAGTPEPNPLSEGAGIRETMEHRFATTAGREHYNSESRLAELFFGIIKEVMGFRRFSLRGKCKANLEWLLVCASYNLKRLHRLVQNAMERGK